MEEEKVIATEVITKDIAPAEPVPVKKMTDEQLEKWRAKANKHRSRLRVFLRSTDLPKPKPLSTEEQEDAM